MLHGVVKAGIVVFFALFHFVLIKQTVCLISALIHLSSLGCGIGYGYLHRIPLRMGLKASSVSGSTEEKSPLLAENGNECLSEDDVVKSLTEAVSSTSLDCGVPTIPTLPTSSSSSTLQVLNLQSIHFEICRNSFSFTN